MNQCGAAAVFGREDVHRHAADDGIARVGLSLGPLHFSVEHFLNGFGHADGKFHLRADWQSLGGDTKGMAEFPDYSPVNDAARRAQEASLASA